MRLVVLLLLFLSASLSAARAATDACAAGEITVSGTIGGGHVAQDQTAFFILQNPSCGNSPIAVTTRAGEMVCGYGARVLVTGQYRAGTIRPLLMRDAPVLADARITCAAPPGSEPFEQAAEAQKWRDWDRVIEITTNAIAVGNARNELLLYQLRANALVRRYRYEEALSDANRVLDAQPPHNIRRLQALNVRGVVRAAQGRYAEAIEDHTLAIDGMNRFGGRSVTPCFHYDRALAYSRNGDEARAAADFSAADAILAEPPGTTAEAVRAKGLYCLGVAKLKLGDPTGGTDIETATRLNPYIVQDMSRLHGVAGF